MGVAKKIIEGGLKAVAKKAPRMSEALEPHIGKRLYITQADRTALDYPQGLLGGPGYTELATIDPAKYKDIAWAVQSPGVAKTLVGSMARNPEEAVFANLIGSPEQHRSNKVVFNKIMDRFQKAVEEDKLTPELHKTINKRLANIKDPKTGKSFFPEDVDILSPEFEQHAQTFHQRAFIADILAGKGVGGRKGTIIDYPQVIKETTDPLLLEAKTGDIGDRLFSLSGNIQERPELHPAFHYSLSGKKESEAFAPAPQGIVLKNFTKDFTERTGRMPTYYDLTRGYAPSEKITEEMIERMYKEGYAKGGKASKGKRLDNTKKERGFLGEIRTPRGDFMTEMSVGEPNTDELFRPSIVPDLHPAEINYMIQTGEVPTDLYPISQRHAEKRISEGKSPFWNEKEDAYAKGVSVDKDPKQIRNMIKSILGTDIQKAEGGAIADDAEEYGQQLKEQRKTLGSDILKSGAKGITEGVGNILRSAKETLSRAGTIGDIVEGYGKYAAPMERARYESVTGKKFPELKPISLLPNQAITESPVDAKILPLTTPEQQFAGEIIGDPLSYSVSGAGRGIEKFGKFVGKGLAEQVQTGKGIIGRNIVNPRANILPESGVNLGVDFFRPSEDTIRGHKMDAMPGSQWYSWLQSNAPKSSKKELETSGTMNWLKDSKEKVSKNDIINHLRENEPNLRSKTYSEYSDSPYEVYGGGDDGYHVVNTSVSDKPISSHETQGEAYWALNELESELYPKPAYSKWTLPGGDDYREIVIQDKSNQAMLDKNSPKVIEEAIKSYGEEALPKLSQSQWDTVIKRINQKFESSHYPEATNPIAHLRINHRDDADGNPTLFIEELQSDWGQQGKKEGFGKKTLPTDMSAEDLLNNYRDNLSYSQKAWLNNFIGQWEAVDAYNNVPNQAQKLDSLTDLYQNWVKSQEFGVSRGPYVEDTKDWTALALKQAIKEAVDNGKTQIAWTSGAQQAERYDLSKHLSSVSIRPSEFSKDKVHLMAIDHSGNPIIEKTVKENELDNYIGKDLANKLINTSPGGDSNIRRLEGLDIKVGGEGMHGYYDKILPQVANDVIKQLGGKNKVKTIKILQGEPTYALRNKTTGSDIGGGYTYQEALQQVKDNPNREMYLVEGGESDQLGFEITPDMIKFIKEEAGIPKFKKGGSIDLQQEYKLENLRRRYG